MENELQLNREVEAFRQFREIAKEFQRDGITPEEAQQLIQLFVDLFEDFKKGVSVALTENSRESAMRFNELTNIANQAIEAARRFSGEVERLRGEIPEMPDLSPIEKRLKVVEGRKIPVIPTDLVKEQKLVDDLTALKEEFEKKLKELNTKVDKRQVGGTRRVFQPYRDDLSASCDGINKTFYLSRSPLKDNTVTVYGTDFPTILRPTIDFTIANKTLTLTSAVPAPNSGATLIVNYFA